MLIMQKEGLSPLQIAVASTEGIEDILTSVVSGADPRCAVTKLHVLKSSGYNIGLELKHVDRTEGLGISHDLLAAMRSIRPEEHFRAIVYVKRWRHLIPGRDSFENGLIGFTVLFGGTYQRLRDIFPPLGRRRLWKVKTAWRTFPIWNLMPIAIIDSLLPSPVQTWRDRKSFPARPGTILLEGIRVKTPSGHHPLNVGEDFLKANTLLFGGTGTGKSTYLHWLALTLIREGRAVCVVDPHGRLFPPGQDLFPAECGPAEHVHQNNCNEKACRNYEEICIA